MLTFPQASITTIVPSAVTVTSTSIVSASEATITVTTTLAQNDKRELSTAGQPKHPHYDIERRGGYPKYVICGI